jgi:arsenate reductase
MAIKIYGIKNCDTMKKTFTFLEGHGASYEFHDYKKSGADEKVLRAAMAEHGWEKVINRRGTTWRKLPDDVKTSMDEERAVAAAIDNPSMIKRPILTMGDEIVLGFDADQYAKILG